MKLIFKILFYLFLFIPLSIGALEVSSQTITVLDTDGGRILFSKNKDQIRSVASISKIMTAILAIESGKTEELVTINNSILTADGSNIYLEIGEEILLKDLVYGLLLRSGNDAALAISNFVGGSEQAFVDMMNKTAQKIGMKNTTFNNPHGLDSHGGNYSTAYDMALLTQYAMNNKMYRTIVKTKKYQTKSSTKSYIWTNKNKLLNLDYITGGKTGFTEKARRTLVSSGLVNDHDVIVVTLNDPDDWDTHKKMYQYVENNYKFYQILDKTAFKVKDDKYYNDPLYIKHDYYYPVKNDEATDFLTKIKLEKKKNYIDQAQVGTVDVYFKHQKIHTENIYIHKKTVVKKSNFLVNWWHKVTPW